MSLGTSVHQIFIYSLVFAAHDMQFYTLLPTAKHVITWWLRLSSSCSMCWLIIQVIGVVQFCKVVHATCKSVAVHAIMLLMSTMIATQCLRTELLISANTVWLAVHFLTPSMCFMNCLWDTLAPSAMLELLKKYSEQVTITSNSLQIVAGLQRHKAVQRWCIACTAFPTAWTLYLPHAPCSWKLRVWILPVTAPALPLKKTSS